MTPGKNNAYILWFRDIGIQDIGLVGGKNAALGEMISNLVPLGINVPDGFAVTAHAYNHFLDMSGLRQTIQISLQGLDTHDMQNLKTRGAAIRQSILQAPMPDDLKKEIEKAYADMAKTYGDNPDVAVRSSATAEDLPGASFAGQQETYLNVAGGMSVLEAVQKAFASLFTDRAISYRQDKGFSHLDIALSVGVQKMVRSDLASSGVAFSIDTETGFDKVVIINSSYGLGEMVVQGKVTPDEFIVFKPTLKKPFRPIISKTLGSKQEKLVYGQQGTALEQVLPQESRRYSLSDEEILQLARWTVQIETYFSRAHKRYQPMDVEWAKDGSTQQLYIVQARPETIHSLADKNVYKEYSLQEKSMVLAQGTAVGSTIASGKVRVIKDVSSIAEFQKGEILVTEITDPDWEPIMKIASAIVTDKGGRTSHAAIVSRELGLPAIVGTENATQTLQTGQTVTIDCSSGITGTVYEGTLKFNIAEHRLDRIPKIKTTIMVNIGAPDEAFKNHRLPVQGVGLGRLEFIIASYIKVHPNALIRYSQLQKNPKANAMLSKIDEITAGYEDKKQYYIDQLAEGIAKISAAFWPHDVIIRFSDFKTNEYRTLLGGEFYEPKEENPMLGWRGASRYYHPQFKEAFGLECKALQKVRDEMGLVNVVPMIPFCRTVEEAQRVINIMKEYGLNRAKDRTLKIYMMCEIPSNVVLAEEFLKIFDGMSIGSNDLAQLTLGLDRDSSIVNSVANENNEAVKELIRRVIRTARKKKKYIGICGQAPSDFPDFAKFLVREKISSISLLPDTVIKTIMFLAKK